MLKISTVELYDGAIPKMRKSGMTLQQIGDKTGVTKERVRQILNQYYPDSIRPTGFTWGEVAKLLKCGYWSVLAFRKKINFTSSNPHSNYYLSREDAGKFMLEYIAHLQNRTCMECGSPLTSLQKQRFCSSKCREKYWSHFQNWSVERRTKQIKTVEKWRMEHPERYEEISRKAMRKYYSTHRESFAKYYNSHKDELRRKYREKYRNDPEFRERELQKSRGRYIKKKQKRRGKQQVKDKQ